jgi:hypothetical protein
MILPPNGAAVCAHPNQIWNGNNGVLNAKLIKKPNHNHFWYSKLISPAQLINCKSVEP